jgi:hypothetical protein
MFAQVELLGDNFLPLLAMAFGAALFFGPGLALIKPPHDLDENDLERPPLVRTILFMVIGLVMAVWALATMLSG